VLGDGRHLDDILGIGRKPVFPLFHDYHRGRLMGPENRRILDDIIQHPGPGAGRADDDQGLGRQVDMFFVLDIIRGDGLVA